MVNTKSISSIVDSYLADLGKPTHHGFLTYLHYAFEALRYYTANSPLSVRSVSLQVQDGQAELPDDFIHASKIAVINNGRAYPLLPEGSIALREDLDNSDDEDRMVFYSFYQAGHGSYYYDGAFYENLAFYRSPYAGGKYRIDREQGRVLVEGYDNTTLYMEYESSDISHCDQEVPEALIDYVKAFIQYRETPARSRAQSGRMITGEAQGAENLMDRRRRQAFNRLNPLNIDQIRNISGRTLPVRNE